MAGQILHSFRVHTGIDLVLKELRVPVGESKKRSASEETLLENDIVPICRLMSCSCSFHRIRCSSLRWRSPPERPVPEGGLPDAYT